MKSGLALSALVAVSQALVARDGKCCFHMTAYGGPGGPVGQLPDGQNRIGDTGLPEGDYCIGKYGGLTDSEGRGCILTPPTTQLQCDQGALPTRGFSVGGNGTISYKGEDTFYARSTGQNGGYNLYTMPVEGQSACVPIWLVADNCLPNAAPPTKPSAPPAAPAPPPAGQCPADLTGDWQFPHLIVPVNESTPDKAYGTQYFGTASSSVSSIFNFDIPAEYAGKQCTLEFLFPTQAQLETSSFEYSPGEFDFTFLSAPASVQTTYSSVPKEIFDFGAFELAPGTATTIGTCPHGCPAGQTVGFMMSAIDDAYLKYFQDSNPCPIGLYITAA